MNTQDINEQMRVRFRELVAQRDAIQAVAVPLREARDAHLQQVETELKAFREEQDAAIAAAEEGLFDICQEIAKAVRFLDGKTGPTE